MARKRKKQRRPAPVATNGTQEKALTLPAVPEVVTNAFDKDDDLNQRVSMRFLRHGYSDGCPEYWSRKLDQWIDEMKAENDYAKLVVSSFANKFSSRAYSIQKTQESELSDDTILEMNDLVLEGFFEVLEKFSKSLGTYCNGGFIFATGNSEEIEPPDEFKENDKRTAYGPLAPLRSESGDILTYSDGTPIYAFGFDFLDSNYCTRTGNEDWPVIYSPYGTSKQYLLHTSRVIEMTFSPSTQDKYNGVGESPIYIARDTLRQLKSNQRLQLQFTGEEQRQMVIVVEEGATASEIRKAWRQADERINNNDVQDNRIPVLGKEKIGRPGDKLKLNLIDINKLPEGFDYAEQLIHGMAIAGAAAYLSLADLGLSGVARMVSRANSEIEADVASSSGIPQLQENLAHEINKRLPEGALFVWEPVNTRDAQQQAELDKAQEEVLSGYIESEVLSALDVLDMLYIDGDIPESIYERRRKQLELKAAGQLVGAMAESSEQAKSLKKKRKAVQVSPVTDALEDNEETQELRELFAAALLAQYASADVPRIIRQARSAGIDDPTAQGYTEQLIPFVEENTQRIEESLDAKQAAIILAFFAALGRDDGAEQANRALTQLELLSTQDETDTWIVNRLRSLLGENPPDAVVPASGQPLDIRNPIVPQSLDVASYNEVARLIRDAQLQTTTDAAASEAYEELAPLVVDGRANIIALDNASSVFGAALLIYLTPTEPVSKTWLRTIAETPRQVHLEQVGETVPIDGTFADGSFWSQSEPACQCSIQVNYS